MGTRARLPGDPHRSRRGPGRSRRGQVVIYSGRPEGGISDALYAAGGLVRMLWRYRSELAPVYWWLGVLAGGAWLHSTHAAWWPVPAAAGLLALAVLVWLPRRPVTALAVRWPVLARGKVRLWAAVFTAAVTTFLTLGCAHGATAGELPTYGLITAVVLGVPWWWWNDRRRLVKVRMIRDRFPNTAEAAGLPGARMVSAVVSRFGWTARLKLRRGQHYGDAVKALPALESALGSTIGALRVEKVTTDAAQVVLRLMEIDPHAHPIAWTPRLGRRPATITAPFTIGVWEDGTEVKIPFLRKHVLIGGATDSGKSGVLNVILARLAECSDVAMWGIDLKGGMEFFPWIKVLDRLATDKNQAEDLLAAGVAELDRRAAYLAEKGEREWNPTPQAPALAIIIDEYAELPEKARKLADSIARRGRAVAVTLIIATQRPSQKAMGEGSAIRSQMNLRICLRVVERGDVDLILGAGSVTSGWDTTKLDAPGKFLLRAPGHDTPRRARGYLITDTEVTTSANHNTRPNHHTPSQPPGETTPGPATHNPPGGTQDARSGSGVSGPDLALWDALKTAGPGGASIPDLIAASGRSKRWVHYRLQALKRDGKATPVNPGRWTAQSLRSHPSQNDSPPAPSNS